MLRLISTQRGIIGLMITRPLLDAAMIASCSCLLAEEIQLIMLTYWQNTIDIINAKPGPWELKTMPRCFYRTPTWPGERSVIRDRLDFLLDFYLDSRVRRD
jgi:hypothetical protein